MRFIYSVLMFLLTLTVQDTTAAPTIRDYEPPPQIEIDYGFYQMGTIINEYHAQKENATKEILENLWIAPVIERQKNIQSITIYFTGFKKNKDTLSSKQTNTPAILYGSYMSTAPAVLCRCSLS